MNEPPRVDRRRFIQCTAAVGASAVAGQMSETTAGAEQPSPKRIRVGVIGCGSVSRKYLPHLAGSPFVELVSTCDIIPQRARAAAIRFKVPNHYPHVDKMLAGAKFDLLVNLTDMQEHYRLNKQSLASGKHVWSEKPIAGSLADGRELLELAKKQGVRIWGAPTVVTSPQFAFMAKTLAAGTLGRVAVAHGAYGHLGPHWSSFFYEQGGGSMPDLGVYNLATLTGLLGPARSVVAMTSIVTPKRQITGKGQIEVVAEDNAVVTMDHGDGALSTVQCGFNYFTARQHDSTQHDHHTISITGTGGSMHLAGYDWAPHGVDLATRDKPTLTRHATDRGPYSWQCGASLVAECLATGSEPLLTPEHSIHVAEIIAAARRSQSTGRRIEIESTFAWPLGLS